MKKLFVLVPVLILSVYISCGHMDKKEPPTSQEIIITASIGGRGLFFDSIPVIHIATTLYNPTKDTLRFLSMTCSYEGMYTTSDPAYEVQSRWDCFSNVPMVVALPPGARTDHYIMIRKKNLADTSSLRSLKIGMYNPDLSTASTAQDIFDLYMKLKQQPVTWSPEIDLQRLNRTVY